MAKSYRVNTFVRINNAMISSLLRLVVISVTSEQVFR
jgi:hypothetical protein